MSKRIEHSDDLENWYTIGAWEDSQYEELWTKLQDWINEAQPYGFFRAIDDSRSTKEIMEEATASMRSQ